MLSLKGLIEKIQSYAQDADLEILKNAYHFSREAHCSQKRSEGSPYIKHPLSVAYILADMKMDVPSISAGLVSSPADDIRTALRAEPAPGRCHQDPRKGSPFLPCSSPPPTPPGPT